LRENNFVFVFFSFVTGIFVFKIFVFSVEGRIELMVDSNLAFFMD